MRRTFVCTGFLFLMAGAATAFGQIIAYDVASQTGNQTFAGNLGMDFDVSQPIVVTELGAFDAGGNGFTGTISVQIFNRDTAAAATSSVALTGTNGNLVNGSRFLSITPTVLPPGHYSVVAIGFGVSDFNGNFQFTNFTAATENSGGALSFVGHGRFDGNATLDYPTGIDATFPTNPFLAGTFGFFVTLPPTIAKSFGAPAIGLGGTTTLTFTVLNPNSAANPQILTGIAFNDTLPGGLMVASPNGLTGSCGGGTITAAAAGNSISLSGAALAAGASCSFSVNILGASSGLHTNLTTAITSGNSGPGNIATAILNVTGSIAPGKFSAPMGVAVANNGTTYVADTGNNRIEVFDRNGNFSFAFGTAPGPGQLKQPVGVSVHNNGSVYVADTGNNRIAVFDSNGTYRFSIGQ